MVATGPSIDAETVKFIKDNYTQIICVSDAYKLFSSYAIALVSSDAKWWDYHKPVFLGQKFCLGKPGQYEIERNELFKSVSSSTNSALFAMIVAKDYYQADKIDLYGVDMSNKYGDHFFGPHPTALRTSNEKSFERFKLQFENHKKYFESVYVINRNPASELKTFEIKGVYED